MKIERYLKNKVLYVAYGVGRDSTALLIRLHDMGIRPDAIVFADVGSEKPETYAYIPIIQRWLKKVQFPPITIVRVTPKKAPYDTIEGNMVMNATLPGIAFQVGSCTQKWKIEPQIKWGNHWPLAQEAWARGEKVVKLIGYDAGEEHRLKRADAKAHAGKLTPEGKKYEIHYPLMDWGWDLQRCIDEIAERDLPVPVKSACFFCPSQHPWEVVELLNPELRGRIMRIEYTAEGYNKKNKKGEVHVGMWGKRPKSEDAKPGSITEFILRQGLKFTPPMKIEARDPMPMNPNCKKFWSSGKVGMGKFVFKYDVEHEGPSLREILKAHGYDTPEAVLGKGREMPPEEEDEFHSDLLDAL